jgi:hypothetical protein
MHELISATQATSESMVEEDPRQQNNLTSHNISPIHAYKTTPILLAFFPITIGLLFVSYGLSPFPQCSLPSSHTEGEFMEKCVSWTYFRWH